MTKNNHMLYKGVCNAIKFVFLILLLFLSMSMVAQTRRALVIGVGQQKDKSWAKINGDKDVQYVKQMLGNAGYTDDDARPCKDRNDNTRGYR